MRRNKPWEVSVAAHKLAGGDLPKMKHGMEFLIFQGSCYSGYISPLCPIPYSLTPHPLSPPPPGGSTAPHGCKRAITAAANTENTRPNCHRK